MNNKTNLSNRAFGEVEELVESMELTKHFFEMQELNQNYNAAIKEIRTKLEILNDEFKLLYDHNPIHHIESRMKSPKSIIKKLKNKGLEVSVSSARENLRDIAGIRVICYYIDDIYRLAEYLLSQDDIELVVKKDYIKNPKPNGYRSLHMVITVPIFLSSTTKLMPVEIQIRTIAMDFWASLEHEIRYKTNKNIPESVHSELLSCAETIAELDVKMKNIHNMLE